MRYNHRSGRSLTQSTGLSIKPDIFFCTQFCKGEWKQPDVSISHSTHRPLDHAWRTLITRSCNERCPGISSILRARRALHTGRSLAIKWRRWCVISLHLIWLYITALHLTWLKITIPRLLRRSTQALHLIQLYVTAHHDLIRLHDTALYLLLKRWRQCHITAFHSLTLLLHFHCCAVGLCAIDGTMMHYYPPSAHSYLHLQGPSQSCCLPPCDQYVFLRSDEGNGKSVQHRCKRKHKGISTNLYTLW